MNELREFGEINSALARRYGSQTPLVFTGASDLFPVISVDDDKLAPELHWLAGSRLCGAFLSRAADAGNQSALALNNPSDSGVIAVLERVDMWSSAADEIIITLAAAAAFTASTNGFFRDSRGWPSTPLRSTCVVGANVGAFSATVGRLRSLPAVDSMPIQWTVPFVITPGERITFATSAVNIALNGSFYWRERRIVSQERGD